MLTAPLHAPALPAAPQLQGDQPLTPTLSFLPLLVKLRPLCETDEPSTLSSGHGPLDSGVAVTAWLCPGSDDDFYSLNASSAGPCT